MSSRVTVIAFVAAVVVFCVVQDRITAAAVGQYVALQRAAIAGTGPAVTIDEVMRPAIRRSVQQGAIWGAVTLAAGLIVGGKLKKKSGKVEEVEKVEK